MQGGVELSIFLLFLGSVKRFLALPLDWRRDGELLQFRCEDAKQFRSVLLAASAFVRNEHANGIQSSRGERGEQEHYNSPGEGN